MMKKITLFLLLLSVSLGFSQTLPFDFTGTLHGFVGDPPYVVGDPENTGPRLTNGAGNDVLQIEATEARDWDNAQVTFAAPIDLSDAANNTLRFTMQSTTAAPGEVHQHGVSFQGAGVAALEGNFQTIGQEVLNVELNFIAGLGSREKLVIFTDVGNLGGVAVSNNQNGTPTNGQFGTYIIDNITLGADPETCSDNIQNQDETGVDCGGVCAPCDVDPPTGFTASAGTIGAFSVELLLNATDNSGNVTYNITGGATAQTTGASGVQKSFIINGLDPETMYSFNVSASDAAGNPAENNPITVETTTGADTSTACAGFTKEVQGASPPFSVGASYDFSTSGTDVIINTTLFDTGLTGLVAQVVTPGPNFLGMTNTGGQDFTLTLTGQTVGADITFYLRFAYAGGAIESKQFIYKVGDDCSLSIDDFEISKFSVYPNPTKNSWTVKSQNENISSISVYDILGKSVLSISPNTNEATIDGSSLKSGLYFAKIESANGVSSLKLVKQ